MQRGSGKSREHQAQPQARFLERVDPLPYERGGASQVPAAASGRADAAAATRSGGRADPGPDQRVAGGHQLDEVQVAARIAPGRAAAGRRRRRAAGALVRARGVRPARRVCARDRVAACTLVRVADVDPVALQRGHTR